MYDNPWTDERITQLTTLWATGISASLIGDQMKMTRNMVLGKAYRLELPAREQRKPAGESRKRKSPKTRAPSIRSNEPRIKPELYIVSVADVEPLHISLMQLNTSNCHYPYGNGPFTFCGCEAQPGKPYCPAHVEISKGKPPVRQTSSKKTPAMGWGIKSNFRVFA